MTIMKSLLLTFFCLLFNQAFSQMDLTLGPELNHENGAVLYKIVGQTEDAVFSIWMDTNGKHNSDEYYLEKHNLKTLTQEFSIKIELPQENQIDQYIEKVFLDENKIFIVNSSQSPRYKKKVLFVQIFNSKGKIIGTPILLDSIEYNPRSTKFHISVNKDGNFKTIVIQKSFFAKKVEVLTAVSAYSLDGFTPLLHKTFSEEPTIVNPIDFYDFNLEENGCFHYMKTASKKVKKDFKITTSLFITNKGESEKEIVIGTESDTITGAAHIYVPEEKAFVVGGYKRKNNKLYSFIYLYDQNGTKRSEKEIPIETNDDKKFVWNLKEEFKKVHLNFSTKHLFYSHGDIWVVGEQRASIKVRIRDIETTLDYFYNLIISSYSLKSDLTSWSILQKREFLKTDRENDYETSTISMFTEDKELYVLYQNSLKNFQLEKGNYMASDLERVVTNENSIPELAKISLKGEIETKVVNDKIAPTFNIRAKKVPKSFVRSMHNVNDNLFLRISNNSFLIYFEEGKVGHWGIVKNS